MRVVGFPGQYSNFLQPDLVPRVLDALHRHGLEHVPVVAGGIIPESDRLALLEMGVAAVFGPGTRTGDIVATVRQLAASARQRTP